jgi:hypothetical protein
MLPTVFVVMYEDLSDLSFLKYIPKKFGQVLRHVKINSGPH